LKAISYFGNPGSGLRRSVPSREKSVHVRRGGGGAGGKTETPAGSSMKRHVLSGWKPIFGIWRIRPGCGITFHEVTIMNTALELVRVSRCIIFVAMLTMATLAVAQVETIDATARGTSTQLGKVVNVKIIVNQYSTPEERATLIDAFKKGANQGLVNALQKMKSDGQISVTGTVGQPLAYVSSTPTPTGRKIEFVTNRLLKFEEVARNTRSTAYNLTAGEIDINDSDASKSAGVLYPAAQFTIDSEGQVSINLLKNPWQLTNIIDWKPKRKEQ
jgi:hypothetical protein